MLWLLAWCFWWTPTVGLSLIHLPDLGILCLLLGCLVHPCYGFCPILLSLVLLCLCCLLETYSFQKRNGGELNLEDKGGSRKLWGTEERELLLGCIVWMKNLFPIKKNCHFIALKFFKPGNIYFTCYYKLWSIIFQFVFLLTFLCLWT